MHGQVQHTCLPGDVRAELAAVRAAVVVDAGLARRRTAVRRRRARLHHGAAVLHRDAAHDRLRVARRHRPLLGRRGAPHGPVGVRRRHPVHRHRHHIRQGIYLPSFF